MAGNWAASMARVVRISMTVLLIGIGGCPVLFWCKYHDAAYEKWEAIAAKNEHLTFVTIHGSFSFHWTRYCAVQLFAKETWLIDLPPGLSDAGRLRLLYRTRNWDHPDADGFVSDRYVFLYASEGSLWLITTVLWAYPAVAFVRGPARRTYRRRKGYCVVCGYNLTGNVSGRCPECGGSA